MKAIVLESAENPIVYKDVETPNLTPGEALVQVKAAALNRRDFWITIGKYAGIKYPSILGSDGAGIVTEVADEKDKNWIGKEVIINPGNDWGDHPEYQSKDFKILGLPDNGTFAQYVKVKVDNLYDKPVHLNWEQTAALPLAGLTVYRALFTKARAKSGDRVLIVGVGAGTGSVALQLAVAAGCKVFVTSGSGDKIKQARKLGAAAGVNYKAQDWAEELKHLAGGFDVVIDSALGDDFEKVIGLCNPGARIVFFGGTAGNIPSINARPLFWKQIQLIGTTMGNKEDFEGLLQMVNDHKIIPVVDEVFALKDAAKAFDKMKELSQFGKLVLTV
ncbi:zinc-binding dehydrogenase [Mucilaginibacter ginkgonis]|uniref:Zinc-binding dehydrogenase n=1 Tax=Mucilaginibacter ginkgonis TaxID=2682091 RepID=A0A6I4HYH4_9SPHI|nr:zinc-binding dehydrogenase [Mucilaginibacter ginkgonis]QQL49639.1 zinc-binding dehydrogenase [Mucilaginibacter ginkgonis]